MRHKDDLERPGLREVCVATSDKQGPAEDRPHGQLGDLELAAEIEVLRLQHARTAVGDWRTAGSSVLGQQWGTGGQQAVVCSDSRGGLADSSRGHSGGQ